MQLVDEGKINLDTPVKNYLRDFQIACSEATQSITVRQLLCHTSGMAGDFFPDDGVESGNYIARYLDRCYLLPQVHPVGEMFSYSNSAYCIAGRLIEVVSGISWDKAVEERIVKPLNMSHVATTRETSRFRTAIGHSADPKNKNRWLPESQRYFPLGLAPAGTVLAMTASDLITFGLAHLRGGRTDVGESWLSKQTVMEMQTSQVELPPHSPCFVTSWGLGWFKSNYANVSLFGHGGQTLGQTSLLMIVPEQNLIFSILLNGTRWIGMTLIESLIADTLKELVGVENSEEELSNHIDNPERFCGQYDSLGQGWEVTLDKGVLMATAIVKSQKKPPEKLILKSIDDNSFATYSYSGGERHLNIVFQKPDDTGCPKYLFYGLNLSVRVA